MRQGCHDHCGRMNYAKSRLSCVGCCLVGRWLVGTNRGSTNSAAGAAGNVFQQDTWDPGETSANGDARGTGEIGGTRFAPTVFGDGDSTPDAGEKSADV